MPPLQTPYNKNNEIIIRMNNTEASKANRQLRPAEIAKKVTTYISENKISDIPIRAAKCLPSGDIAIIAANQEEVEKLRGCETWTKAFSDEARQVAQTYGVLVHGVKLNELSSKSREEAIEYLKAINIHSIKLDIAWIT